MFAGLAVSLYLATAPANAQNQNMEVIHHPNYDKNVFMPFVPAIKIKSGKILWLAGTTALPVYHDHPHNPGSMAIAWRCGSVSEIVDHGSGRPRLPVRSHLETLSSGGPSAATPKLDRLPGVPCDRLITPPARGPVTCTTGTDPSDQRARR
jgi:hypothetical protein